MARKPRQFFKASDWELEDAEGEDVEIVVNRSPKEFVVENGRLVGMHAMANTTDVPLNAVPYEQLHPGSAGLAKVLRRYA